MAVRLAAVKVVSWGETTVVLKAVRKVDSSVSLRVACLAERWEQKSVETTEALLADH